MIFRALLLTLVLVGCGGGEPQRPSQAGRPLSSAVVFGYGTTQGGQFASATTRGRVTAVLFVTTFDMASQLMARRLNEVVRRHRPRSNAGAVVLEPPSAAPLAEVFRQSLDLVYPVAMSDTLEMTREDPFGEVESVPTLVVLDRSGRIRFRQSGVLSSQAISDALSAAGQ